jgi:hypothetical protein
MQLLIDADILLYKAGFAAQKTLRHVFEGEQGSPDAFYMGTYDNAADAKAFMEQYDDVFVETEIEAEPVGHAIHNLKTILERTCEENECSNYLLVLSGDCNFRDAVAFTRPYKGNRDKLHKPVHYAALKEYIIAKHPHIVATDCMEGDDVLGIMQQGLDTTICSIDKDLLMIEGIHYNLDSGKTAYQEGIDSWRAFVGQLITGDTVDNVPGLPGMGKKKAEKLLLETPRAELWDILSGMYMEAYNNEDVIYEQARLLWILRTPEQLHTPPDFKRIVTEWR